MNREEALAIWAPDGSPWSPWTKAVLFSFMSDQMSDVSPSPGAAWKVPLLQDVAILVELAGARGVEVGISLAYSGYRPIPLYNACPYGSDASETDEFLSVIEVPSATVMSAPSVIDVVPIMRAIANETSTLKAITLPLSAPPAFLLDANRQNAAFSPEVGWFDNRSIVRQSDLPTATFLKEKGIRHVIVIRANQALQSDLQTVLLSWQEAGMTISKQAPVEPWGPVNYTVPRKSLLKVWWDKLLQPFGYRLNSSGSFGRFVHGSGG
jgi:hypothetical protein